MQIKGTHASFNFRLLNSPNEKRPSKGPYVYPAIVNNSGATRTIDVAIFISQ